MKKILAVATIVLALSGCAMTSASFTHNIDLTKIDYSNVDKIKEGESCEITVLGLFGPFGDKKLVDAVKDGKIKSITNYDYRVRNYILFQEYCTRAYGY